MASHTAARRPASRQNIDSDDALAMRAAEMAAWTRKHGRAVLYAAVAALVLIGGFFWMRMQRANTAQRAATAFLEMQASLPADTAAALRQIVTFADRYEGTADAAIARIQIAQTYLGRNQPKQAIEQLRRVADGGTPVAMQARSLLAAAQARDGQRDEAIRTYLQIAEDSELAYEQQQALNEAALLREQAGDWRGAAELYRRILETTEEGSVERSLMEMRIAEADARAAAPAPAPAPAPASAPAQR